MADECNFDVGYVAKLARLQLTADETQLFQEQIGKVLAYADQLRDIDVADVEPAAHSVPIFDVTRADEARDWFTAAEALQNAPRQANGLFIVPKVVE